LKAQADPGKAGQMQTYMKSAMPYRGVSTGQQRLIYRKVFARHPIGEESSWKETVLELWRSARFREERYAAIALTGHKLYDTFQTMKTLPMYEELVVSGAWWDYVDAIATHRLRLLLQRSPVIMKKRMRSWSRCSDMWKRRSSILCQVGLKGETDLDLLYDCIAPNLADEEFFIRKAIGWALREYAWTDPKEVRRYVRDHEAELSTLSRREALRNLSR